MSKPRGIDLMRTLIELLAEQEGCIIEAEIECGSEVERCVVGTGRNLKDKGLDG